jgi:CubicO group peptidase (beta-lactamase class C family)
MFTRRCVLSGLLAVSLPPSVVAQGINNAPASLGDGWAVARPADAGFDQDALAAYVKRIDAGIDVPNINALLIEHEGRLVFERYWPGEDRILNGQSLGVVQHGPKIRHDIRSISKSVTSMLLGIALGRSAQDALARPITSFLPRQGELRQLAGRSDIAPRFDHDSWT